MTPLERLQRRSTVREDGCWTWNGCVGSKGYGSIALNGKSVLVHRLAYELLVGPIPDGLQIDHRCHNDDRSCSGGKCDHRICWRPDHLEAVAGKENVRRRWQGNAAPTPYVPTERDLHDRAAYAALIEEFFSHIGRATA